MKRRAFGYLSLLLLLIGCEPLSDCYYEFSYNGQLVFLDSVDYRYVKVGIENLDRVVYVWDTNKFPTFYDEFQAIDSYGIFKINGQFLGECPPAEIKTFQGRFIKYEIRYNDSIILQSGRLDINETKRSYSEDNNLLTIEIPTILIK